MLELEGADGLSLGVEWEAKQPILKRVKRCAVHDTSPRVSPSSLARIADNTLAVTVQANPGGPACAGLCGRGRGGGSGGSAGPFGHARVCYQCYACTGGGATAGDGGSCARPGGGAGNGSGSVGTGADACW